MLRGLGGSIQFFLYDAIKIMVLLGVLILVISYIQSYFPPERAKKSSAGFTAFRLPAPLLCWGTVTLFCSGSSIPLFIGFTGAGLALGVVLSFMMGVTALSLPFMVMLRKAVKPKLPGIFVAICTSGIIPEGHMITVIRS